MAVNAPSVSLKVIFVVHLVLSVWASTALLPAAYIYMNAFMLIFGVLAIMYPDNAETVLMFFILNVTSILNDVILICVYATAASTSLGKFSLAMAIINLLVRPLSCFIQYRLYQDRTGQYSDFGVPGLPGFGTSSSVSRAGGYENIDQGLPTNSVETASPHSTIDKSPVP